MKNDPGLYDLPQSALQGFKEQKKSEESFQSQDAQIIEDGKASSKKIAAM